MANYSASSDPPVVRTSSHGNSRNLTAVTPLSKECHHKRLYPSRAKKKREEEAKKKEEEKKKKEEEAKKK